MRCWAKERHKDSPAACGQRRVESSMNSMGLWGMRGSLGGGVDQGCIRRGRTSEATPEAIRQAIGGGCQSGWGRLLSVTNAIEAGTWRSGDSGWARAGRPRRGVACPPFRCNQRGGFWVPKFCVPKMAQSDFSDCKFRFFSHDGPFGLGRVKVKVSCSGDLRTPAYQ